MSSLDQCHTLQTPEASPVWAVTISWNPASGFVNGRYLRWLRDAGVQLLAGLRMFAVLLCAASLEVHFPGLGLAGGAPFPLLASITAVYVLSSSYPRMLACCMLAGLLHDIHSPSVPLGSSGLILIAACMVARRFLECGGRDTPAGEFLVGGFVCMVSMLGGHLVLVSCSGAGGGVSSYVVLRRIFGCGFVVAVILVPLLLPAKLFVGRFIAWFGGLGTALLSAAGGGLIGRLPPSADVDPRVPDHPVPA